MVPFTDAHLAAGYRAVVRAINDGTNPVEALRRALSGNALIVQHVSVENATYNLGEAADVAKMQEHIVSLAKRCRDAEARLHSLDK